MFQTPSTYAPPCIVRKHIFRIIWKRIDRSKIGDSILPDASLVKSPPCSFRDNCAAYILPVVNYCAHYEITHTDTDTRVRPGRACVRVYTHVYTHTHV